MSNLKVRASGAWVTSDKVGAVRLSGAWVPFGSAGGPTYEAIDWISAPTLTNADDGSTTVYNMGCRFTVTASKLCYGVRWRVPDSIITPPGGSTYASLYRYSPLTQHAKQSFTPVPGGDQDILFTTPVTLLAGDPYVVGIFTVKYSFRAASSVGGFPFESPSGNVVADIGMLNASGNSDDMPASQFESIYYVSPLVEV